MLSKNEEKFLERYEAPLQKPKWKFILTYGLSWAAFVFLFTTVANLLLDFKPDLWSSTRSVAINLAVWLLAGIVYGIFFRRLILKQYGKIKVKQGA